MIHLWDKGICQLWYNYPAVNMFCEFWPFGTYDPDTRPHIVGKYIKNVITPGIFQNLIVRKYLSDSIASKKGD